MALHDNPLAELNMERSENKRLRAALDKIGAMFFISHAGTTEMKPEYGYYDILETVNEALEI